MLLDTEDIPYAKDINIQYNQILHQILSIIAAINQYHDVFIMCELWMTNLL